MSLPSFVPLVGSNFDSLGQSQLAWAGFNANQDQANLRRQQMAEEAANNWFGNLAHMQSEENARRDRLDQAQQESDRRNALVAAQTGYQKDQDKEAVREFNVRQKLAEDEFKWKKDAETRSFSKEQDFIDDLGNTMAPHVQETGAAYEQSRQALADATTALKTAQAEWATKLPGGMWDARSEKFVKKMGNMTVPWSPAEQKISDEAAADIAAKQAAYANADREHKEAAQTWNSLVSKVPANQLYPYKDENGNWGLRSPLTKKNYFAKTASKAKDEPATDEGWAEWAGFGGNPATTTATTPDNTAYNRSVDIGKLAGLSMGTLGAVPFIPELAPKSELTGLRQQALAAIQAGADPAAVKARYRKLTGMDLN